MLAFHFVTTVVDCKVMSHEYAVCCITLDLRQTAYRDGAPCAHAAPARDLRFLTLCMALLPPKQCLNECAAGLVWACCRCLRKTQKAGWLLGIPSPCACFTLPNGSSGFALRWSTQARRCLNERFSGSVQTRTVLDAWLL